MRVELGCVDAASLYTTKWCQISGKHKYPAEPQFPFLKMGTVGAIVQDFCEMEREGVFAVRGDTTVEQAWALLHASPLLNISSMISFKLVLA